MGVFNLIAQDWLPVRLEDGSRRLIRPAEIVAGLDGNGSPAVAFDWGRADFDAASREFMIGLLAVAYAGLDDEELIELWERPPTITELDASLGPYTAAFDLDGDGPRFLQDLESLGGEAVPVSTLLIDAPGANTVRENKDLFQKRGGIAALSRPAAAMALFTLQAFAPSGGAGHRTSLRGGGPLTTLIRPLERSLWHLLLLNCPVSENPLAIGDWPRVFPWLVKTRTSEKGHPTTTPPRHVHPLQAFWGMPRRIRLDFSPTEDGSRCDLTGQCDEVKVVSYRTRPRGTNYEAFIHPLTPYYRRTANDVEWLPVHPQPGGITYRHWPDIAVRHAPTSRRAECVTAATRRLREIILANETRLRIIASGYDMDNMKPRGFVETEMPFFVCRTDAEVTAVTQFADALVGAAARVAFSVVRRVKDAIHGKGATVDQSGTPLADLKLSLFAQTETAFFDQVKRAKDELEAKPDDPDCLLPLRREWLGILRRQALLLFDNAVPLTRIEDRKLDRAVEARRSLGFELQGYGKDGQTLYSLLNLAPPEPRKGKRKKEAA